MGGDDGKGMRVRDLSCPICHADVPLSGDEGRGDEVFCTYCGAPCTLVASGDEGDWALEEDF